MTNPTPYKIECPHCGTAEAFNDTQSQIWGLLICPKCNGEFTPKPMPLDEYDKLWAAWESEMNTAFWDEWNARAADNG